MGRCLTIWLLALSLMTPVSWAQAPSPDPAPPSPLELAKADGYMDRPDDLKPGSLIEAPWRFSRCISRDRSPVHRRHHYRAGSLRANRHRPDGWGLLSEPEYLWKPEFSVIATTIAYRFYAFAGSRAAEQSRNLQRICPFDDGPLPRHRRTSLAYRYVDNLNTFSITRMSVSRSTAGGSISVRVLTSSLTTRRGFVWNWHSTLRCGPISKSSYLGLDLERLENRTDGWARQYGLSYLQAKMISAPVSTLKRFYLVNRIGYGMGVMQFSERRGNVPAIFSSALNDSWLYLETGVSVHLGKDECCCLRK